MRTGVIAIGSADRGSSVGVSVVQKTADLSAAFQKAFAYSDTAIIQEFIKGREVTCGVLDDGQGNATVLPPTEIIPNTNAFFDYQAKYTLGASREITPPDMPPEIKNHPRNSTQSPPSYRLFGNV